MIKINGATNSYIYASIKKFDLVKEIDSLRNTLEQMIKPYKNKAIWPRVSSETVDTALKIIDTGDAISILIRLKKEFGTHSVMTWCDKLPTCHQCHIMKSKLLSIYFNIETEYDNCSDVAESLLVCIDCWAKELEEEV